MTDARLAAAVEAAALRLRQGRGAKDGRRPLAAIGVLRPVVEAALAAADAWDREHCGCGHGWEYHGPEVPGCCECKCRNIRRATAVRIVEDDDFAWDEPREPRPVPR